MVLETGRGGGNGHAIGSDQGNRSDWVFWGGKKKEKEIGEKRTPLGY